MNFFKKLFKGLSKTRDQMDDMSDGMFSENKKVTDEMYDVLEEMLIMADVGGTAAAEIRDRLKTEVKKNKIKNTKDARDKLKEILIEMLSGGEELNVNTKPSVMMVIGVNGVGKTTTIGKISAGLIREGKTVLLGAADTFRAAAIEQLEIWAERSGADIVKQAEGSDPAAVVFDSISAGKARGTDVIICDTAGRLHNKKHLMDELSKMMRIVNREAPDADKEILLVLDATTGQNAVNQAKQFSEVADITGIVLTKLDGTAKGGVVIAIKNELNIPIKFIGVGEQIDDLERFNPEEFVNALFSTEEEVNSMADENSDTEDYSEDEE